MAFNFQFRFAEDRREIDQLAKFLLLQPFNYEGYEDWVERTREELFSEYKSCILAFGGGALVGNLVYQPHKQFPRVRELKNLRVDSRLHGRYFGAFMLRQAERENPLDFDAIICDARSDRLDVVSMLRMMGYQELLRVPLYDKGVEDLVFIRAFERTPEGIFMPIKRNLVARAA
jgi:hypothetical protein